MSGMEELARLINSEAGDELVILRNQDGRPDDSEEREEREKAENKGDKFFHGNISFH